MYEEVHTAANVVANSSRHFCVGSRGAQQNAKRWQGGGEPPRTAVCTGLTLACDDGFAPLARSFCRTWETFCVLRGLQKYRARRETACGNACAYTHARYLPLALLQTDRQNMNEINSRGCCLSQAVCKAGVVDGEFAQILKV